MHPMAAKNIKKSFFYVLVKKDVNILHSLKFINIEFQTNVIKKYLEGE